MLGDKVELDAAVLVDAGRMARSTTVVASRARRASGSRRRSRAVRA